MEYANKRDSNIELLRIISIFLIIGHHLAVHSGFYFQSPRITGNMLFLQWLSIGGKVGVDLFVLISGYFLVTAAGIRAGKVVKLWLQLFFYSAVIYLTCVLTGLVLFTADGFLGALLPVLSGQWWFAGSYLVMYLLSPVLNRLLRALSRKKHLLLLAVLSVLWYVIPVCTWLPERLRDPLWFLFLYCIAGYLRLHGVAQKRRANTWLSLGILGLLVSFGWALALLFFTVRHRDQYETVYFQTWNPLLLAASILLFLGFAERKIGYHPRINAAAAAVFGIYLIHDSNYLRYPLWRDLLHGTAWRDSPLLIPFAIAAIAGVWLLCLALERLRMALLDRPCAALAARAEARLQKAVKRRTGNP